MNRTETSGLRKNKKIYVCTLHITQHNIYTYAPTQQTIFSTNLRLYYSEPLLFYVHVKYVRRLEVRVWKDVGQTSICV